MTPEATSTTTPATEDPNSNGPVAVIAVHGVADQTANQTAVTAADLLLHLDGIEGASAMYGGFEKEHIRVGTQPLKVTPSIQKDDEGDESAWGKEIYHQLEHYEGEEGANSYDTVRLEGLRYRKDARTKEVKPEREVHVYEMYWADYSRLGNGLLSLIMGIYRLTFQLAWLGVATLKNWPEKTRPRGVQSLIGLHWVYSWLLTRMVPVFNLLLVALLFAILGGLIETEAASKVFGGSPPYPMLSAILGGLGVAVGLGVGAGVSGIWRCFNWPILFALLVGAGIGAGGLFWFFTSENPAVAERLFAGMWWLCVSGLFAFTIAKLSSRHPALWMEALAGWVILTGFFVVGLFVPINWPIIMSAGAFSFMTGLALLTIIWLTLYGIVVVASILDLLFQLKLRFGKKETAAERKRGRARLGTALISMAMPTLFVMLLNLCLWGVALLPLNWGLMDGAIERRSELTAGQSFEIPGWIVGVEKTLASSINVHSFYLEWLKIQEEATNLPQRDSYQLKSAPKISELASAGLTNVQAPFTQAVFGVFLFVGVYTIWCLLPSAAAEMSPWKNKKMEPEKKRAHLQKLSQALGQNLSSAYGRWLWFGQMALIGGIIALLAGFVVRDRLMDARIAQMKAQDASDKAMLAKAVEDQNYSPVERFLGTQQALNNTLGIEKELSPPQNIPLPATEEISQPKSWYEQISSIDAGNLVGAATSILLVLVLLGAMPATQGLVRPVETAVRAGTDIGLDVTNYLRRHPRTATTRAKILSRYASLLKYICEWRKPGDATSLGYSRVVILAHSQGTVMTVDLLRLLKDRKLTEVNEFAFIDRVERGEIDLRMFTMGSPLRQLYGRRFPDTFGWARPEPSEHEGEDQPWRFGPNPDQLLGVRHWWNAFRAADYVGRYLWHPTPRWQIFRSRHQDCFVPFAYDGGKASTYPPTPPGKPPLKIREYCLSPGAHTHYWDKEAPEVACDLDRLIALSQPHPDSGGACAPISDDGPQSGVKASEASA